MAKTITGIKAGTTTITATYIDGGVTKTSQVSFTVSKVNPSLTFSVNSTSLTYNGAAQLLGTVSYTGDGQAKYYVSTSNSAPSASASGWVNVPSDGKIYATNAGTYYVFLQATEGTNYNSVAVKAGNTTGKAIAQKAVTYKADNQSWVYDGGSHSASNTATLTSGSLVSGHTATFSCSGSVGPNVTSSSGTKTLSSVTIKDSSNNDVSSNYSITKSNGTLNITARPINVTASSASRAYNGSALTSNSATAEATGTNRGLVSGHTMTSCTVTGSITNVGTADNVASEAVIKDASSNTVTSNYDIEYVKGTLTITQRSVTITAPSYNGSTLTYNGSAQTVASGGSCTTGGTMYYYISTTNSTPTFSTSTWSTSSNVQATNAGTYYVWYYCRVTDTTNNTGSGINTVTKISSPASKAIGQKAVTVTAASDSKTYDGTALTKNSASLSGQVSGHTLASYTVEGSQTLAGSSSNVPSADRINDGNGNNVTSNYSITYTNGTLTVNKRSVTYTATNESWTYNGSSHSASNTATLTSGSLPSGHTATITCGGSITYVDTATKTISVVIKNSSDTDVSSSFTITATTGTLTVTKATPAITVTGVNQTYNNTDYYAKVTKTDAKGTLYWKYGSAPTTSSYDGTTDISSVGTPVGNPAALSTAINVTSVKNVTNQTLYWIFVPSSSATITSGQTYAANFDNSASGSVTMKITAAAITIPTPTGYTGTYDASAHTATFPAATGASITNYRYSTNNSTWTETNNTTNPSQTNYGTLYVQAYYTADSNHSGSGWSSSATIKINQKAVTVTAGSASKTYDGSALTKADGTTASGLISGHSLTSYTNTGSQTYVGSSNNVPSAAVIKSGSTDVTSNYAITYANGTLTVSKANPVVTVTGITADYTGGSFYATAKANAIGTLYWKKDAVASASSYDGSVKLSTLNTNANVTFVKDNADDFVMYWYFVPSSSDNITSGQTYAANFNNAGGGSSDKVNLTINPRDIANISVTATATTYNGASQTATLSAITDAGGNVTSSDYTISGNTGTNAGNYTITFTGKNNYTGTKTISWTINKRAVTITAGSDTKTYDGTALTKNTVSASAQSGNTGMISSHHVHSWTVSGSQTIAGSSDNVVSAATIYNGTHSGTESDVSSNYTITFAKGTLTVDKRTIAYTARNQSKVYDGSALSATATADLASGSLPTGHTATFTCTGSVGPAVGSATKTLSNVVIKNSSNTDVSSSFTITKNNGTLTITNATITYTNTTPVSEYCTATATATNKTLGNVTISVASASATDYAGNAITSGSTPATEGYTISQDGWSISADGKTITIPANVTAGTYNITVTAAKPNHTPKSNGISVTLTAVSLTGLAMTLGQTTIAYGGSTTVTEVRATYSNGAYKDVKNDLTPNASTGNRITADPSDIVEITTT